MTHLFKKKTHTDTNKQTHKNTISRVSINSLTNGKQVDANGIMPLDEIQAHICTSKRNACKMKNMQDTEI